MKVYWHTWIWVSRWKLGYSRWLPSVFVLTTNLHGTRLFLCPVDHYLLQCDLMSFTIKSPLDSAGLECAIEAVLTRRPLSRYWPCQECRSCCTVTLCFSASRYLWIKECNLRLFLSLICVTGLTVWCKQDLACTWCLRNADTYQDRLMCCFRAWRILYHDANRL